MNTKTVTLFFFLTLFLLTTGKARAEVVTSSAEFYQLKQQAESTLPPEQLWLRLIEPNTWWHPDHTYSGDAENLSLDIQAGGYWREDWAQGSVMHGQVLQITTNKQLRLNAPFGPLLEKAVNVVWTITITASEKGSTVVFDEVANGSKYSELDKLAPAVDFVKTEAIKRLVQAD